VCGVSFAVVAGSNPVEGMDICLLCFLCVVQVGISATGQTLVQGSPTVCVCVCVCVCFFDCDQMQLSPPYT
jgi:hypothetical protein